MITTFFSISTQLFSVNNLVSFIDRWNLIHPIQVTSSTSPLRHWFIFGQWLHVPLLYWHCLFLLLSLYHKWFNLFAILQVAWPSLMVNSWNFENSFFSLNILFCRYIAIDLVNEWVDLWNSENPFVFSPWTFLSLYHRRLRSQLMFECETVIIFPLFVLFRYVTDSSVEVGSTLAGWR